MTIAQIQVKINPANTFLLVRRDRKVIGFIIPNVCQNDSMTTLMMLATIPTRYKVWTLISHIGGWVRSSHDNITLIPPRNTPCTQSNTNTEYMIGVSKSFCKDADLDIPSKVNGLTTNIPIHTEVTNKALRNSTDLILL